MGWRSARRRLKRWLRRDGRFYLAFAFTVVVVSYVAVPFIARLVDSLGEYNPVYYEPKDFAREAYLEQHGRVSIGFLSWETAFKIGLLIAVGVIWRVIMPARPTDRASPRR